MKESDGKTGEPAGFSEVRKAYQERIHELAKYGAEDGTAINPESQGDFGAFIEQRPRWRKGLTELLNNGNLRAVWKDGAGNHLGLQFLGGQKLEYVIFRRRPNPGEKLKEAGRDTFAGIYQRVEQPDLLRLVTGQPAGSDTDEPSNENGGGSPGTVRQGKE